MIGHYFELALRSFRKNPVLTAMMVVAIGLGVGASMTVITVLHVLTGDPMPGRSHSLFVPHLDPLPANYQKDPDSVDPSDLFTYPDAMALIALHKGNRQAAMAGVSIPITLPQGQLSPFSSNGRMTTSEFFAMFGVPLVSGHTWSAKDDGAHARVVVLSKHLSLKLFGARSAIGQTVDLADHSFTIIGVTANWAPKPLFYADPSAKVFGEPDDFFIPLSTGIELNVDAQSSFTTWASDPSSNLMTDAKTTWLQFWVQLNTPEQRTAYTLFLRNYADEQRRLGRFERPASTARLYGLTEWLAHENLVPRDVYLRMLLALAFLVVCIANIAALLLTKFMRRSGEVGVRRALGATRQTIILQFAIESVTIGLAGGVLGMFTAGAGLWIIRQRPDDYAKLATMDPQMLLSTIALSIVAALLAGVFPAWRISRVTPALQLKVS